MAAPASAAKMGDSVKIGYHLAAKVFEEAAMSEKKLDDAIEKLDGLTKDDFDALRRKRLQQLKARSEQEMEWRRLGHGKYEDCADEKAFFEEVKTSDRVVCHFYSNVGKHTELMDKHLRDLAPKHLETRFIRICGENSPFLVERLSVVLMPTLIVTKDAATVDRLEGFDELGGTDKFTLEMLERRLSKRGGIEFEEPAGPPAAAKRTYANANNPTGAAIYASRRKEVLDALDDEDD